MQEAIYSLLMMKNGFICESANIDELDPEFADMPIVRERRDDAEIDVAIFEQLRVRRHQRHARFATLQRLGTARPDGDMGE